MNNFFVRTLSGIVYAALVLGSIFAGPLYFTILSLFFLYVATREFSLLFSEKTKTTASGFLLIPNILIFLIASTVILLQLPYYFFGVILVIPFLSLIYILLTQKSEADTKAANLVLGIIYIPLPLILMISLFYPYGNFFEAQIFPLIGIFIILWLSDTMAYISGSLFGRTKLFERLSPGKTIEGTLGGLVFSILGAWILSIIFKELSLFEWMGFAVLTVIFGTFGDLFESMLKRRAGVKESGNLFPGHGGVLDRLDSMLFAAPVVYVYLMLILNL